MSGEVQKSGGGEKIPLLSRLHQFCRYPRAFRLYYLLVVGVYFTDGFAEVTPERMQHSFEVNVIGPMMVTQVRRMSEPQISCPFREL